MPTGLALGLLASVGWGLMDVTVAVAARRIGSLKLLVGTQLSSLAALGVLVMLDPSRLGPDAVTGMLAGAPLGVVSALAYLAYFTAFRIGPVSIVSPVIVAYGGATVLLAVVLRGETLLPAQAMGAVTATMGVVLAGIVFDARSMRGARIVGPGVLVAVLTLLLFALVTVILAGPIRAHGWLPVIVGSRLANVATSVLMLVVVTRAEAARFGAERGEPVARPAGVSSRGLIALVVAGGVFDILAVVAYAIGLGLAPVWLVGLASSFGPVIVIGYAVWRMGERLRPSQWLGVAMIGAGVVVLAVAA